MINRFMDEVVSRGAEAVLPQNLDEEWLDMIYVAAKNFLKNAINEKEETDEDFSDLNSTLMLTAVTEIAQHIKKYDPGEEGFEIEEELFFEYLSCYAISVVIESICREAGLDLPPPSTDNIFDRERLFEIEMENPDITKLLNAVIDPGEE